MSLYRNGKCCCRIVYIPISAFPSSLFSSPPCLLVVLSILTLPSPLVMIRRMTDKLGHLAHGHQKTLQQQQQQQPVPGLPLSVTTHTHLEHRGSISTQRTSESSKRGESVDETRLIGEPNFPYQCRAKGTYRLADFLFQRTLGTGSFGRVHLGKPIFGASLSC